jgi:hypothetical protein
VSKFIPMESLMNTWPQHYPSTFTPYSGSLPQRAASPAISNAANFSTPNPPPKKGKPIQPAHLARAGLLFSLGLITHHLPGKAVSPKTYQFVLPPDWKSWARVGLGVATVSQLNKGMNWQPPAWLTGVESAAVITPMSLRFSKTSGLTALLVAPLVASTVQTSQWANQAFVNDLKQQWHVPEPLSRLLISLTVGGLGIMGSMIFHRQIRKLPVEKLPLKKYPALQKRAETLKKNLGEILGPSMLLRSCSRGCSPSIICLSEIGEMLGGMWHWFQNRPSPNEKSPNGTPLKRR